METKEEIEVRARWKMRVRLKAYIIKIEDTEGE